MSTAWFSYRARWHGVEYTCTPEQLADGLRVHLHAAEPKEGFQEVQPGRCVRVVQAAECDMVAHVIMVCQWRGEPCLVHAERSDERTEELLIEYTGGKVPRALDLGMERIERGVYRRWVPRDELRGLRESMTLLVRGD